MESFVFEEDVLSICAGDKGIPTHHSQDHIVQKVDLRPNDMLVAPGYIVRQTDDMIHCTYPNGQPYYSVTCTQPFEDVRIQQRHCYGLDKDGDIHIYPFHASQATKVSLPHRPNGWCIVSASQYIVHWNVLSLQVTHLKNGSHQHLKGHYSRITCGDATTSVVATGDRTGHLCVWYVASWTCHHNLCVSHQPCQQVLFQNDLCVAIRTVDDIFLYDVTTGARTANFQTNATDMQWCSFGLVVATQRDVRVYKNDSLVMTFPHKSNAFLKANHNRVWSITNRNAFELYFDENTVLWPSDIVEWIRDPVFPCPNDHWPKRYLQVLTISARQWIPLVRDWQPPNKWFRDTDLREAIWDTVLDLKLYEHAHSWTFLSNKTLRIWFLKCEKKLEEECQSQQYSEKIVDLLCLSYQHLDLNSDTILKWCWRHHGYVRLRSILMYFLDHDFNAHSMHCITQMSSTPDSIMCFSGNGATLAFRNGWFYIFIRWMQMFHYHYPHEPTAHMCEIYTAIVDHVYQELDENTMHIPLRDSGQFKPMKRLMPNHSFAYVRQGTQKGFVTKVDFGGASPSAQWRPIRSTQETPLDIDTADVWTFHHAKEPHTMLECALYLMDKSVWSRNVKKMPFQWFESNVGAFMSIGKQIYVFGELLRVHKVGWLDGQRYLDLDSTLRVLDSETVDLHWVTKTWSYIDDNIYHLAPLRLKICHNLSMTKQQIPLDTMYAAEVIQCVDHEAICDELTWPIQTCATAIVSSNGPVFMGSRRGLIYQYETMVCTNQPTRIFDKHPNPIRQLWIVDTFLVSMCQQEIHVWNLRTGICHMSVNTEDEFVDVFPGKCKSIWIIEEYNKTFNVVKWDIDTKSPTQRKDMGSIRRSEIMCATKPDPCILAAGILYYMEHDRQVDVKLKSDVTCLAGSSWGICGGMNNGDIFTIENKEVRTIKTCSPSAISAICTVPDSRTIVIGTLDGHVYVYDDGALAAHQRISDAAVHCLHSESLFTMAACKRNLHLLSIVPEKAILSVHALNTIFGWTPSWKTRLLHEIETVLHPTIATCLEESYGVRPALSLLDKCTEEYQHCGAWCSPKLVDLLLEYPGETAHKIIRRVASFRGPRFECTICADEEKKDKICYITPCHHRFHQTCIDKLVQKTPEYHEEMQYNYALSFTLKCPVCRTPFEAENVKEDTLLNKYLYIPYMILNK